MKLPSIWILNHYAMTPELPGGTRHYDLAQVLAERGYKVVIFAASFMHWGNKDLKLRKYEMSKIEHLAGITFIWLKTFSYRANGWKRYVNMISYLFHSTWAGLLASRRDSSISNPNIIIGSSVHLLAGLAAYWLSRIFHAHFVMEVRDLWPQTLIDMGKMSRKNIVIKFLYFLEKYLYLRAEKIVVLPPTACDYISRLGIAEEKIVWIPNGVNLNRYYGLKKNSFPEYSFIVMYAGSLGETNGVDLLIEAAARIPCQDRNQITFQIIGDGTEKLRLQRMKEERKLDNVLFFRAKPKSEIPQILMQADVLVHIEKDIPQLLQYGSSPNKIYDYMAAGKPLIISSKFIREDIGALGCGIHLAQNTAEMMARAILDIYHRSPEDRERMGRRSQEYVKKHYGMDVIADKFVKDVFSRFL